MELFDFVNGDTSGFKKDDKEFAKQNSDFTLNAPTMTSNRPGRIPYYVGNYIKCTVPHPDPTACKLFQIAAETATLMTEEKTGLA